MAEESGLVAKLVTGAGALVLVTIVVFIIVSTLTNATLLRATESTSSGTDNTGFLNTSGHTLVGFNAVTNRAYSITTVINGSGGETVQAGNYTFNSATGLLTNASAVVWPDINVTFSFIPYTEYENVVDDLGSNLTSGVDNVGNRIPTILLIGAVVLLFGVIVLLLRQSQAMGFNGQSGSL